MRLTIVALLLVLLSLVLISAVPTGKSKNPGESKGRKKGFDKEKILVGSSKLLIPYLFSNPSYLPGQLPKEEEQMQRSNRRV